MKTKYRMANLLAAFNETVGEYSSQYTVDNLSQDYDTKFTFKFSNGSVATFNARLLGKNELSIKVTDFQESQIPQATESLKSDQWQVEQTNESPLLLSILSLNCDLLSVSSFENSITILRAGNQYHHHTGASISSISSNDYKIKPENAEHPNTSDELDSLSQPTSTEVEDASYPAGYDVLSKLFKVKILVDSIASNKIPASDLMNQLDPDSLDIFLNTCTKRDLDNLLSNFKMQPMPANLSSLNTLNLIELSYHLASNNPPAAAKSLQLIDELSQENKEAILSRLFKVAIDVERGEYEVAQAEQNTEQELEQLEHEVQHDAEQVKHEAQIEHEASSVHIGRRPVLDDLFSTLTDENISCLLQNQDFKHYISKLKVDKPAEYNRFLFVLAKHYDNEGVTELLTPYLTDLLVNISSSLHELPQDLTFFDQLITHPKFVNALTALSRNDYLAGIKFCFQCPESHWVKVLSHIDIANMTVEQQQVVASECYNDLSKNKVPTLINAFKNAESLAMTNAQSPADAHYPDVLVKSILKHQIDSSTQPLDTIKNLWQEGVNPPLKAGYLKCLVKLVTPIYSAQMLQLIKQSAIERSIDFPLFNTLVRGGSYNSLDLLTLKTDPDILPFLINSLLESSDSVITFLPVIEQKSPSTALLPLQLLQGALLEPSFSDEQLRDILKNDRWNSVISSIPSIEDNFTSKIPRLFILRSALRVIELNRPQIYEFTLTRFKMTGYNPTEFASRKQTFFTPQKERDDAESLLQVKLKEKVYPRLLFRVGLNDGNIKQLYSKNPDEVKEALKEFASNGKEISIEKTVQYVNWLKVISETNTTTAFELLQSLSLNNRSQIIAHLFSSPEDKCSVSSHTLLGILSEIPAEEVVKFVGATYRDETNRQAGVVLMTAIFEHEFQQITQQVETQKLAPDDDKSELTGRFKLFLEKCAQESRELVNQSISDELLKSLISTQYWDGFFAFFINEDRFLEAT